MPYGRSQEIEKRLNDLVRLVRAERHSTPTLARALHTSQPTVSRCLTALRDRGYEIRSVRDDDGWRYELINEPATPEAQQHGR
jgi:biotin operon repressor